MSDLNPSTGTAATAQGNILTRLKIVSIILGTWMFLFGFLKLFPPISGMFRTQITNSGLPSISIPMGISTEILVGLMFLIPWLSRAFPFEMKRRITILASLILVFQMLVAIYVHLQPAVPAAVLPLGIKPPFIPLTVLVLAALDGFFAYRLPAHGEPKAPRMH
jgi:hypothetical protein